MAQRWFYQTSDGQQSGPVGSGELRRLAEAGIVGPETLVRQGDRTRWVRAEKVRGLFQRSTPAPSPSPPPGPPPVTRRSANQVSQEAELARRRRANGDRNRGDGDHHRDGNAALSEFIPNFDPDEWDEDALKAFRCIAEAVNRLREGLPFRNTGTSCPFSLHLDWDDWDDDFAALLAQLGRAIEQARAAVEDGEPFPSADFVFRFDESIFDDDLVVFVRRIQVELNGLRAGKSPRAMDAQRTLFDLPGTNSQDRKDSTPPSKPVAVPPTSPDSQDQLKENGPRIKHQLKPGQRFIDVLRARMEALKKAEEAQKDTPPPPDRKDESSWERLVVAARDSGQHGKAVELAEQAVREYPRSDWLWRELGGELTKVDRLDEAETALDTAHRLNPKAEWLWRHFAALHRKRKNLEAEIESLETLYSLGVAAWQDLNQLGIAYHNYRDLAKALKYYRLAAAAEPEAAPWVNLALVYRDPELSQDADAADACRRALALKPDYERAKELLETTKRKLVPLAARAQSAATGLVEPDEFFDFYISPFEMLQIEEVTVAEGLDVKAIQQAKKRLLAELELNDGKVGWLGDYSLDKARALAVVDELDDEANRRYHVAVYRNRPLLNFLTRGDIQHFLYSDGYFPCGTEELLHREPGFRTFLSKPFAKQYNRVLTRAIEQRRLPVVEVLFDGRRWVELEDEDLCFEGASKRVGDIVEAVRSKASDGCSRKVSLREMEDYLREHSLPELFNLLPAHFASYQGEIVAEIRSLAISCFNEHGDPLLSKGVLSLCKRFTSRNVALNKQLQEDFKAIEAMILALVSKTTRQVHAEQQHNQESSIRDQLLGWAVICVFILVCAGPCAVLDSCTSTKTAPSGGSHAPPIPPTHSRESGTAETHEQETPRVERLMRPQYVRPARAPNGSPWPPSASYIAGYPQQATGGLSSVTVDASRCDSDVFLKLVSVSNTREFTVRVCFIPAYSKFTFQGVAQGNYDVRYRDLSSGLLYKTEAFTLQEITRSDGIEYHNVTMTLYPVAYGNMHTEPIDESEFL